MPRSPVSTLATLCVDERQLADLPLSSAKLYAWTAAAMERELDMFIKARALLSKLPSMSKTKFRVAYTQFAPYLSESERAATQLLRRRKSACQTARKKALKQKAAQRAVDAENRRLQRENERLRKLNCRMRETLNATGISPGIRPCPSSSK